MANDSSGIDNKAHLTILVRSKAIAEEAEVTVIAGDLTFQQNSLAAPIQSELLNDDLHFDKGMSQFVYLPGYQSQDSQTISTNHHKTPNSHAISNNMDDWYLTEGFVTIGLEQAQQQLTVAEKWVITHYSRIESSHTLKNPLTLKIEYLPDFEFDHQWQQVIYLSEKDRIPTTINEHLANKYPYAIHHSSLDNQRFELLKDNADVIDSHYDVHPITHLGTKFNNTIIAESTGNIIESSRNEEPPASRQRESDRHTHNEHQQTVANLQAQRHNTVEAATDLANRQQSNNIADNLEMQLASSFAQFDYQLLSIVPTIKLASNNTIDYPLNINLTSVTDNNHGSSTNPAFLLAPPPTISLTTLENDAPVLNDAIFQFSENNIINMLIAQLSATDANQDSVQYAIVSGNTDNVFTVDNSTGALYANKSFDYESDPINYTLTIRVTDSQGDSTDATINILLNPVNEAAILNHAIVDQNIVAGINNQYQLANNIFIDPEGDNLVLSASDASDNALASWLTFNASTQRFDFSPNFSQLNTQYAVKVSATDSGGLVSFDTFNFFISAASGGNDGDDGNDINNTLNGDNGNNTLYGYAGDDIINGDTGNDTLIGGDDHDTLTGGLGNDILQGGDGDDIIFSDVQNFDIDLGSFISNMQLWLDASDVNGDGTALTNGAQVATWVDKSGQNNHATQASVNNQATYELSDINNQGSFDFDGVNDFFNVNLNYLIDSNYTIISISQHESNGGDDTILGSNTQGAGNDALWYAYRNNHENFTLAQYGNDLDINGNPAYSDPNEIAVSTGWFDDSIGHTLTVHIDNTAYTNSNNNTTAINSLSGGYVASGLGGRYFNGDISEILIFDKALSHSEYGLIYHYFEKKYAININNGSPDLSAYLQGTDTITGGAGSDTFYFNSDLESGVGIGNRDIITDFSQTDGDRLNITGINQSLFFVGANALFGNNIATAAFSIDVINNRTVLQIDSNGDGAANSEIELTGQINLTTNDFLNLQTGTTYHLTVGNDNITGTASHDTLTISSANFANADIFNGAAGFDTLNFTGGGTFTLTNNFTNFEKFVFDDNNYTIDVTNTTIQLHTVFDLSAVSGNHQVNVTGINQTLSINNDTAHGSVFNETINASAGDDTIHANAGDDIIIGGYGADVISGGAGDDTLYGDNLEFRLADFSSLQIWLDAADLNGDGSLTSDGSNISVWTDKAGGDENTSQSNSNLIPVYETNAINGHSAVQFDGVNDRLELDLMEVLAQTDYTIFSVDLRLDNTPGWILGGESGGTNYQLQYGYFDYGGYAFWLDQTNNWVTAGLPAYDADNVEDMAAISMGRLEQSTGHSVETRFNNTIYSNSNANTATFNADTTGGYLGNNNWDSRYYTGYIGEVLVFDSALSTNAQQAVREYLSLKWGLPLGDGSAASVDTLTGGTGSDTFVWTNASYSGVGLGNRDIITDFSQSDSDLLDITGFQQNIAFVGAFALAGHNIASANYTIDVANNRTIIHIDANGDAIADSEIELTGQLNLTTHDFTNLASGTSYHLTAGQDSFVGTALHDTLNISSATFAANDSFNAAGGYDTLNFLGGGNFTITTNFSGFEKIVFDNNTYHIDFTGTVSRTTHIDYSAISGSNTITLSGIEHTLTSGDDVDTGTTDGDIIKGFGGNDTISGGAGNDILEGGMGSDSLNGGAGDDILYSGLQGITQSTISGLGNLGLWLDGSDITANNSSYANGTLISTWADKSGNNRHAIQAVDGNKASVSNNSINGQTTLSFDNTDNYSVDLSFLANTSYSIFTVDVRADNSSNNYLIGTGTGNSGNSLHIGYRDSDTWTTAQWGNDLNTDIAAFIPNAVTISLGQLDTSIGHNNRIFHNGTSYTSSNSNTTGLSSATNGEIGQGPTSQNYFFSGNIAEILIFDTALSSSEENIVLQYLGSKYGQTLTGLTGDFGIDILTGGTGSDTFRYSSLSSTGVGAGNRDTITDFSSAEGDILDIAELIDGVTVFKGNLASATLNTTGIASVGYEHTGGNTLVQIDYQGDGTADAEIELTGIHHLTYNDFVLTFGDIAQGTSGNDVINGTGGDEVIYGAAGHDTINGGGGNDYLFGEAGNDILTAGINNDYLEGGAGIDILTGGNGADYFTLTHHSHSGVGSANRDVITDFSELQGDKIDLSALNLTFIGSNAFSTNANELRFINDGSNTLLQISTDTDQTTDLEIELTGHFFFDGNEFIGVNSINEYNAINGAEVFENNDNQFAIINIGIGDLDSSGASLSDSFLGGNNHDTLRLTDGITIDFTVFSNVDSQISNIERIDLVSGEFDNVLTLAAQDVLDMSDASNRLFIDGSNTDSLLLSQADGVWTQVADSLILGISYDTYTSGTATIYASQDIMVNLNV